MEFVYGLLGGLLGAAVGVSIYWLVLRQIPKADAKVVNTLSIDEATLLVEKISEGYVRGIRSVLGLDLAGEVVSQEAEEDDLPISPVNALEMDPFMGEELEWQTLTPPNNGNEGS